MDKLFSTTIVGSHMWDMEHENSDIDYYNIFLSDPDVFLLGKNVKNKNKKDKDGNDVQSHELGNVIPQLIKANQNYLWGVMSPKIITTITFRRKKKTQNFIKEDYDYNLFNLREIVKENISKECFGSIDGMAKHNLYHYNKNGLEGTLKGQKKLSQIAVGLEWGIHLLNTGEFRFEKLKYIPNIEKIAQLRIKLKEAYVNSKLPAKSDPKPYNDFLIKIRLKQIRECNL